MGGRTTTLRIDRSLAPYLDGWVAGWVQSRETGPPERTDLGWYVATRSTHELERHVLTSGTPDQVRALAEGREPRTFMKFAGEPTDWMPQLPSGWKEDVPGWFLTCELADQPAPRLSDGYRVVRSGTALHVVVEVLAPGGEEVVASGHLGIAGEWAVPDQIATAQAHRRRGLGSVVMAALGDRALDLGARHAVLGATADGRALYERLGWRTLAPTFAAFRAENHP